jgi:hypothetical protein
MKQTIGVALLLLIGVLPLQGCIVGEIRDELKTANAQLTDVHQSIEQVNSALGKLDTTNNSLGNVDQRLKLLQSIENSLARLDVHLASLRQTIGKIDHAIPFLGLGGNEEMPPELAQGPGASAPEAAVEDAPKEASKEPPKEAGGGAPKEASNEVPKEVAKEASKQPDKDESKQASKPRDPMLGTWLERYPGQSLALVLLSDGKYIRVMQAAGQAVTQRGTWKREGAADYAFTPETPPAPPPAPPGQKGQQGTPAAPGPWKVTVISLSARSATVMVGDQVLVLARP